MIKSATESPGEANSEEMEELKKRLNKSKEDERNIKTEMNKIENSLEIEKQKSEESIALVKQKEEDIKVIYTVITDIHNTIKGNGDQISIIS